jgi:hypothetical protein
MIYSEWELMQKTNNEISEESIWLVLFNVRLIIPKRSVQMNGAALQDENHLYASLRYRTSILFFLVLH